MRNYVNHATFQTKSLYVVKLGYIIDSIHSGIINQNDFIWRLVAGCIEIAAYNGDEAGHWLFVADVDRVANSVITGVFGGDSARENHLSGCTDRMLDGLRFSEVWDVVADVYDMTFDALGQDKWMSRLQNKVLESGATHLLFPLLHVLERDGACLGEKASPMAATAGVKEAVEKNLRHLIGAGFLPIPRRRWTENVGLRQLCGEKNRDRKPLHRIYTNRRQARAGFVIYPSLSSEPVIGTKLSFKKPMHSFVTCLSSESFL